VRKLRVEFASRKLADARESLAEVALASGTARANGVPGALTTYKTGSPGGDRLQAGFW
jgi:hypothetical protein